MSKSKPDPLAWISPPLRAFAVPIAELTPDPGNARRHPTYNLEAIRRSLERFGQQKPIVCSADRIVRCGNGTMAAALAAGRTMIAAVISDLSPAEIEAYAIADNRSGELAEWDPEKLKAALGRMPADLQAAAGWDGDALRKAMGAADELEEGPAPDQVEPVTRAGNVWALGEHRLMCGDATDADCVGKLRGSEMFDLVMTSPPYNCDIDYQSHDDAMPTEKYLRFIGSVAGCAVAGLRKGRFVAWNVGVSPKSMHFEHASILSKAGLNFYRQIVWAKAGVAFPTWQFTTESGKARKYHPNYTHEMIFLFCNGDPEIGGPCDVDDAYSRDVWHIHQSAASRDLPGESNGRRPRVDGHGGAKQAAHPAAFPIGVPAGCIKHLTAKGEVVYEPFSGAGTTMIACEQLGRRCFAMEIEPRYVDLAISRWEKLTGQRATLEDGTDPRTAPR